MTWMWGILNFNECGVWHEVEIGVWCLKLLSRLEFWMAMDYLVEEFVRISFWWWLRLDYGITWAWVGVSETLNIVCFEIGMILTVNFDVFQGATMWFLKVMNLMHIAINHKLQFWVFEQVAYLSFDKISAAQVHCSWNLLWYYFV